MRLKRLRWETHIQIGPNLLTAFLPQNAGFFAQFVRTSQSFVIAGSDGPNFGFDSDFAQESHNTFGY